MIDINSRNPLTDGQSLAGDVTDNCRDVLKFMAFVLPILADQAPNESIVGGAAFTLDMVSKALQEIEDCKLPWAIRDAEEVANS